VEDSWIQRNVADVKFARDMKSETEHASLDEPVCPHCVRPITAQHHFCPHCNAPLTSYATSGPYEQVLAQGYAVRAGVARPANSLVVFGMWLIFAPTLIIAIISAGGFILAWGDGMERHATMRLVGMVISGFWIVLAATILWKSTRNYLRRNDNRGAS
jgi:hypothetical protein